MAQRLRLGLVCDNYPFFPASFLLPFLLGSFTFPLFCTYFSFMFLSKFKVMSFSIQLNIFNVLLRDYALIILYENVLPFIK